MQGLYGETMFTAKCLQHGFSVSKPISPSSPYDFIVDNGVDLLKIQVKCTKQARKNKQRMYKHGNDVYEIDIWKHVGHNSRKGPQVRAKYTPNQVDVFAFYLMDINTWYIFPFDELEGMKHISIRPDYDLSKHQDFKENWNSMKRV